MSESSSHSQQPGLVRAQLDRDRIIDLLGEMISTLSRRKESARIRIVGGSAIALMYSSGRDVTADIDAISEPESVVSRAAEETRGSHPDLGVGWFNGAAGQYLPNGFGRAQEWVQVFAGSGVTVEVPSAEMLLAMKIDASQRRGRRDGIDLPYLLGAAGITNATAAEQIYESFYPGDELIDRSYRILDNAVREANETKTVTFDPEVVASQIQSAADRAQLKTHRRRFPELAFDDHDPAQRDDHQLG